MKIKHLLIPSKHNKFHPHILRPVGLAVVLAVLVLIPPVYNVVSAQQFQVLGYATNISIDGLNQSSNKQRTDGNLKQLTLNDKLNSAALAKAKDMLAKDYWAHVAPDGTTPWYFINESGYKYFVAGENLAKGYYTSADVVAAWMASPTHKENVLNSSFEDVGYGIVDGTLKGSKVTLVVAVYGLELDPSVTQTVSNSSSASTLDSASVTPDNDSNSQGQVLGSILSAPVKLYQSLNWGQKASILISSTLILLFVLKHTLIWRQQRRGLKHIWLRSHPIGQASILIGVVVITLASGIGAVL